MNVRNRWRLVVLALLIVVSAAVIFVPGIGAGGGDAGPANETVTNPGLTNIQFGLELSGGTRVRAPVVGTTAEGVNVTTDNQAAIQTTVAEELGVDVIDVQARPGLNTVEVFSKNVSDAEFRQALDAAGASPETIRQGVTAPTRETVVETLQSKINAAGLSGGSVTQTQTAENEHYVIIEVPNENASAVRDLVSQRGVVRLVASFPAENATNGSTVREETVITKEDITSIGQPRTRSGRAEVPIVLSEQGAAAFASDMQEYGFTKSEATTTPPGQPNGQLACDYDNRPNETYCLLTVRDERVVYSASMSENLAQGMESGDFQKTGSFVITSTNMSEARQLQIDLQAGALPAPLDIEDRGTVYYLAPALASQFKLYSLVTGLVAVLAVSFVVYVRYTEPSVAAPMVVTALSEVVILLGFASAIGLPLDLSHIAGFIAVIGTGVDDLIIIADEVMTEQVSSGRVFASRFRKALWVIGAAAVTTIIAMSPLAVLSLGDLRGFAIVTILGVLVGVLITRPAYGDILRALLTDR
jgi:preprotein translocase subunit SecD